MDPEEQRNRIAEMMASQQQQMAGIPAAQAATQAQGGMPPPPPGAMGGDRKRMGPSWRGHPTMGAPPAPGGMVPGENDGGKGYGPNVPWSFGGRPGGPESGAPNMGPGDPQMMAQRQAMMQRAGQMPMPAAGGPGGAMGGGKFGGSAQPSFAEGSGGGMPPPQATGSNMSSKGSPAMSFAGGM